MVGSSVFGFSRFKTTARVALAKLDAGDHSKIAFYAYDFFKNSTDLNTDGWHDPEAVRLKHVWSGYDALLTQE